MNKCKNCGNESYANIVIFTETTFGHGDSSHKCYVKCTVCDNKSKEEWAYGLCDDTTIRKVQQHWNNENPET